ncbi:MAG: hypothetical protein AAF518_22105, partial [Spirochaetota bacterium]
VEKFLWEYPSQSKTLILASTYNECEEILFPLFPTLLERKFDIWIFPHKPETQRIATICDFLDSLPGAKYQKFSEINNDRHSPILVFDTIGVLAFAYKKAWLTYVGGAVHNRVHNTIEPAYFGSPLITGKRIYNAAEAQVLEKLKGLFTFQSQEDVLQILDRLENSNQLYQNIRKNNQDFVANNRGASLRFYEKFLSSHSTLRQRSVQTQLRERI